MLVAYGLVAGVPLGWPSASSPDRGPGLLPSERGRGPVGLAGVPAPGSRRAHLPGVAAAVRRAVALPARRRAAAPLRGRAPPEGLPDLVRRCLPELLRRCPGRYPLLSLPAADAAGTIPAPARHWDRLRRRGHAHLVRGSRAGRGVGGGPLRPGRPRDLRVPGRRPAAPVRDAVAAVAWSPAPERRVAADLLCRPAGVHRGRHLLRLHHGQLDLPRWRPRGHPVVRGADHPVRRGRIPATGQADRGVRAVGPGSCDASQRPALPRGRGQLPAAHDRRPEERQLQPPGRRPARRGGADGPGQRAPVRRLARQ